MTLMETTLPGVKLVGRGKVRDIFEVGENLLIVATDRLSAFDVVLPDPIPDKGKVLNAKGTAEIERAKRIPLRPWIPSEFLLEVAIPELLRVGVVVI